MHTLVCRVFKWNYEQHLYGQTFLSTDIRFAGANAPLKIKLTISEDKSYISISNFCSKQLIPNGATLIVQKTSFLTKSVLLYLQSPMLLLDIR